MSELPELLRKALELELSTDAGRINLAFGTLVIAALILLYAGDLFTEIGDFILKLFRRDPGPDRPGHKLAAFIFTIVFFVVSLLISEWSRNR